jgi:asparagine synthase (glutamine-hydrolysing)
MCGLTGFTGEVLDYNEVIGKMTDVITHRGPDSSGVYTDDGICMGFRRLSIIDIAATGDQPIYNEDKNLVIMFNGEIYNYQQLREELIGLGHQFYTHTDTEVILHGFEEWQEKVLDRLRGMFCFAIWNRQEKSLFMARDFFGIKPMHYAMVDGHLVYGSEIKSILEFPGFEKKLNLKALDSYLSFEYVVPPQTMFEGITVLLPGHYLWYKDGKVTTTRYWEPKFEEDDSITEEQAVKMIEDVFEDSVQAHRIADVEVGCFLSSGVDSSYVASYFGGQKSFTVGFGEDIRYNEISYAQDLSKEVGLDHHYKLISPEEYWGNIKKVQYHMDQPEADASCIALYFVSKIASQYVKVVLSGEGADELFGGYNIYHEPDDMARYKKVPLPIRKALAKLAEAMPFRFKGKNFLIRGAQDIEESFIGNCSMITMKEKRAILRPEIPVSRPQELTKPIYDRVKDKDDVTKMQYLDLHVWMAGDILLKADRMSMANSLELRVPFLDKNVWEVARHLPKNLRVNSQNTKYAMRKAAERHLPQSTAQKKKLGFPVPTRVWLREEPYYTIVKNAFQSETSKKFFNPDALIKLLDEHKAGKVDNNRKIWTIFVFLMWYDVYFNGASHEPGSEPVMSK